MCKIICQACVLCGLQCLFSQTMNLLFKKRQRKTSVQCVCLIQFWYSIVVSLRLLNFTFDSPWDVMLANVVIAAVQCISLKLIMANMKKTFQISTQQLARNFLPKTQPLPHKPQKPLPCVSVFVRHSGVGTAYLPLLSP